MNTWRIENDHLVYLLRANGFTCDNQLENESWLPPGAIIVDFRLHSDHGKNNRWFKTNCPIEENSGYILPDGSIIKSEGASLILEAQAR